MSEFETPPETVPRYELSPEAINERERILIKARSLLNLAAAYLAAERQKLLPESEPLPVETGDLIQAAEIVFVGEGGRLPWLADLLESLPFDSCFLSYSTRDRGFCKRLNDDLQAKGVRCWYFHENAKWGRPVWEEIGRSVRLFDRVIVICSKNSLTSNPVLREIERALQREDDERKRTGRDTHILFPITIDNYVYADWQHPRKPDVLVKVVGDFRGWRNLNKYNAALTKLLDALQHD